MADTYYMDPSKRRFAGIPTKIQQRVKNVLGIINDSSMTGVAPLYRKQSLEQLDAYYEQRQYANMPEWDQECDDDYVAIRKRKPRIIYNLPKALVERVAAKLTGQDVWPNFDVPEDPATTDLLRVVQKLSGIKHLVNDPIKKMLGAGSSFSRFMIVDGTLRMEAYCSKYCYPIFQPNGELESVRVQYVYSDEKDKDAQGNFVKKWYRLDLGMQSDILYDNPVYKTDQVPVFTPVETTAHGFGFVQGEWFRTCEDPHSADGYSLYQDILGFCDELNYSLSQSSQAVGYNQEPQTVLSNISEDEMDSLIRSSQKAWNLGREGKAEFLESNLGAVETATKLREAMVQNVADITRVVMQDPEKLVGSAQSGKALEILHAPLLELINELRPMVEKRLVSMLTKMSIAMLKMNAAGFETLLIVPTDYVPQSFEIEVVWPPVFPMTMTDLKEKVGVAVAATSANIVSRETATRWLAKDFGIEDVDAEIAKIAAQPVINPFGGF